MSPVGAEWAAQKRFPPRARVGGGKPGPASTPVCLDPRVLEWDGPAGSETGLECFPPLLHLERPARTPRPLCGHADSARMFHDRREEGGVRAPTTFTPRSPEWLRTSEQIQSGFFAFSCTTLTAQELPSLQGHGELRSGNGGCLPGCSLPSAPLEPSDQHGCRAACHVPGSGRLLLLAVLSPHSTEMLLRGNRCAAGDGEREQRALNIQTMASVPSQGSR